MTIIFVRIYGDGIVKLDDLPESLRSRGAEIQAWVDRHYPKLRLGHLACLRIDREFAGDFLLTLMISVHTGVLDVD